MLLENPIQIEKSNDTIQEKSMAVISGTVIDFKTKSVIQGAKIHIWNSMNRSAVSLDGNFILEIPEYLNSDVVILEVKNKNYDSKIISYKIKDIPEFLTIELNQKGKSKNQSSSRKKWRLFDWSF